jgi:DNA uptake protein ComE-like DNA-binding protein
MFGKIVRILAALCALALLASTAFPQADTNTPPPATKRSKTSKSGKTSKSKLVDINSATKEALDAIFPGGDTSQKIIAGRPYNSKHDLVTKNIITQATYDQVKSQIIAHRASTKNGAAKASALAPSK